MSDPQSNLPMPSLFVIREAIAGYEHGKANCNLNTTEMELADRALEWLRAVETIVEASDV